VIITKLFSLTETLKNTISTHNSQLNEINATLAQTEKQLSDTRAQLIDTESMQSIRYKCRLVLLLT
jgi:septal ring factor EnvC (AmiA/AmiB activator)